MSSVAGKPCPGRGPSSCWLRVGVLPVPRRLHDKQTFFRLCYVRHDDIISELSIMLVPVLEPPTGLLQSLLPLRQPAAESHFRASRRPHTQLARLGRLDHRYLTVTSEKALVQSSTNKRINLKNDALSAHLEFLFTLTSVPGLLGQAGLRPLEQRRFWSL